MKSFNKKLKINKVTIDILDDKALQNIKGGASEEVECSCWFLSCNSGGHIDGGGGGNGGGSSGGR